MTEIYATTYLDKHSDQRNLSIPQVALPLQCRFDRSLHYAELKVQLRFHSTKVTLKEKAEEFIRSQQSAHNECNSRCQNGDVSTLQKAIEVSINFYAKYT